MLSLHLSPFLRTDRKRERTLPFGVWQVRFSCSCQHQSVWFMAKHDHRWLISLALSTGSQAQRQGKTRPRPRQGRREVSQSAIHSHSQAVNHTQQGTHRGRGLINWRWSKGNTEGVQTLGVTIQNDWQLHHRAWAGCVWFKWFVFVCVCVCLTDCVNMLWYTPVNHSNKQWPAGVFFFLSHTGQENSLPPHSWQLVALVNKSDWCVFVQIVCSNV